MLPCLPSLIDASGNGSYCFEGTSLNHLMAARDPIMDVFGSFVEL